MKINRPISEDFREAYEAWVAADAAARMLEEGKSVFLHQRMQAHADGPISRAEQIVKASKDWSNYIKAMVRARTKANERKVTLEYIKMRYGEQQSDQANERAAARL